MFLFLLPYECLDLGIAQRDLGWGAGGRCGTGLKYDCFKNGELYSQDFAIKNAKKTG